jgi:hypothetical protein
MKPVDIRNENWADILARLDRDRLSVHAALLRDGPHTTRGLAEAMGWDPFSVRPRVTELCQMGLARMVGRQGREGVYGAVPVEVAAREFRARLQPADGEQMLLRLDTRRTA